MYLKRLSELPHEEKGQALTETVITVLIFIVIILMIVQLALIMNAKMLTNYAAYYAVRAGIVHNGDIHKMRQAAAVALLSLYTKTSDMGDIVKGYGLAYTAAELGWIIDVSIIHPSPDRFSDDYEGNFFPVYSDQFTSQEELDDNIMTVRVNFWYKLEIPIVDQLLSIFSRYGIKHPLFRRVKISSTCTMRMQSDNEIK